MNYELVKAKVNELPAIYDLINQRIAWMDQVGIRQWNVTGYWTRYPESYYETQTEAGRMLVLKADGQIVAAGVIYEEDERWENSTAVSAYYLHHFVTGLEARGAGSVYLERLEDYARKHGKSRMRLDCAIDSPKLNHYYESRGYVYHSQCVDGLYAGNNREKFL